MQLERITKHTKPAERPERWQVVDAEGKRLGRLASRIAVTLQGKHRPDYSRHQLAGDFVIVLNAAKVDIGGNKRTQKIYYRHTGYVGHLRSRTFDEMLDKFPERVIEMAVKGMLPRNKLGRQMLRRLKVYAGGEHPHEAQVNAGTGKAKRAPAAPATRPSRRRAAAAKAAPVEEAQAVAVEAQVEAVEAAAPADEASAPKRRTRRRAAASTDTAPAEEAETSTTRKRRVR
jgi:large subunit ribosomal protein L13